METHPVPQNVTTFEFHLFGNVTFKQFGYLAVGLAIAFFTFVIFGSSLPLLAYPIMFISSAVGGAYAFLPIMERPLDYWTSAFIKAITKPTLRKFQPNSYIKEDTQFNNRIAIYFDYLQKNGNDAPEVAQAPQVDPTMRVVDAATPQIPQQAPQQPANPTPSTATGIPTPPILNIPVQEPQPQNTQVLPQQPPISIPQPLTPSQPAQPPAMQQPVQEDNSTQIPQTPFTQPTDLGEFSPFTIVDHPQNQQSTPVQTPPPTPEPQKNEDKDKGENPLGEFLHSLNDLASDISQSIHPSQPATPQNPNQPQEEIPSNTELEKTVELAKEAQVVQQRILQTEKQLDKIKTEAAYDDSKKILYAQEFQTVLAELQKLNQKARDISRDLAEISKKPSDLPPPTSVVKPSIIPTLTLTTTPNIINGIVTDASGNYLEGAIVVAHDKQALPVRALKTNKLGQFIAATPLPEGIYTLTVEKEGLLFDVAQLELKGAVVNPVVITAKRVEAN